MYVFQEETDDFFGKMVMNWKKDETLYKRHMYVYKKKDVPKAFYIVLILYSYILGFERGIYMRRFSQCDG